MSDGESSHSAFWIRFLVLLGVILAAEVGLFEFVGLDMLLEEHRKDVESQIVSEVQTSTVSHLRSLNDVWG